MSNDIVALSASPSSLDISSFALWRKLRFHRFDKESHIVGNKRLHHIILPVSSRELRSLHPRIHKLLLRRIEEAIPSHALVLLHPDLQSFPDYRAFETPLSQTATTHLLIDFLPEILATMIRQWGISLSGTNIAIQTDSGSFTSLAKALTLYAKNIYVVTDAAPAYQEQNYFWEHYGLSVCFQKELPPDVSLVILADVSSPLAEIPADAILIDVTGLHGIGISPSSILFRFPGALSAISIAIGGIRLPTLSLMLTLFYGFEPTAKNAEKAGFSISRIHRPKGKFSC